MQRIPNKHTLFRNLLVSVLALLTLSSFFIPFSGETASPTPSAASLKGKFLIEVESYGRAWYLFPKNGQRYYVADGAALLELAKSLASTVSKTALQQIPQAALTSRTSTTRWRGWFVTTDGKQFWYVGTDGRRFSLSSAAKAQTILREQGRSIKDKTLATIPMNTTQITFDPTFHEPTYSLLRDGIVAESQKGNEIRPIASLTKLMTALVVLDSGLDWTKPVVITKSVIQYPKDLVGGDTTSEVDLQAGDEIAIDDLWVSMLVASSNQSAVALADATGLSHAEFVAKMNAKAKSLGLKRTHFSDIAGLNANTVSTANEMARIAATAFAQDKIASTTRIADYQFIVVGANGSPRTVGVRDRNFSLLAFHPDASKVGFLVEAQRTVVLQKDNSVVAILNAQSMKQRNTIIQQLLHSQ